MEEPQNPYAAPAAPVLASASEWDQTVKADRGIRLVARLIDFGLGLLAVAPLIVAAALSERSGALPETLSVLFIAGSAVALLGLLVMQLLWLHRYSQTLGKRWMGIRIVRNDGSPASFGRILGLRILVISLIEQVPCLGLLFAVVNALWIFGEESRCLHDLLADTKVVNA
jgi:uncharacterized RDD family membrane protein YckC